MIARSLGLSLALLVVALPAAAQNAPSPGNPEGFRKKVAPEPPRSREERLNALFGRLAAATSEAAAGPIAQEIERVWRQSGSDTADLLLQRVEKAIEAQDLDLAIDLLDYVLTLQPNWAEAWNRRATAHYLRKDFDAAMRDVARVLKLEPRHFGALAGMAMMLSEMERMGPAVRAARAALAVHPHLDTLKSLVERFGAEADGQAI
jgi:tetratricopeptide (TPR) repeat protein